MGVDVARAMAIRAEIGRSQHNQQMVTRGVDPLVDRHGRELFGAAGEPDGTPADLRYVPPKRVLLEWIGQTSPLHSEVVLALKARGMLTPFHRIVLEKAALMCIARVDGRTSRTIGERDGLTETIRWGPARGTYIREVSAVDADRLLASAAGREFRLVGTDQGESRHEADDAWRGILAGLRAVSATQHLPMPPSDADAARIRTRWGEAERLTRLAANSNAAGYWQ